MKTMKRSFCILVCIAMLLSAFPFCASASETEIHVVSWSELQSALASLTVSDIVLDRDITYMVPDGLDTYANVFLKVNGTKKLNLGGNTLKFLLYSEEEASIFTGAPGRHMIELNEGSYFSVQDGTLEYVRYDNLAINLSTAAIYVGNDAYLITRDVDVTTTSVGCPVILGGQRASARLSGGTFCANTSWAVCTFGMANGDKTLILDGDVTLRTFDNSGIHYLGAFIADGTSRGGLIAQSTDIDIDMATICGGVNLLGYDSIPDAFSPDTHYVTLAGEAQTDTSYFASVYDVFKFVGDGAVLPDQVLRIIDKTHKYKVTEKAAQYGSFRVSTFLAAQAETVNVTTDPITGAETASVSVKTADGQDVPVTETSENRYSFVMPAGDVTVSAVFSEIGVNIPYLHETEPPVRYAVNKADVTFNAAMAGTYYWHYDREKVENAAESDYTATMRAGKNKLPEAFVGYMGGSDEFKVYVRGRSVFGRLGNILELTVPALDVPPVLTDLLAERSSETGVSASFTSSANGKYYVSYSRADVVNASYSDFTYTLQEGENEIPDSFFINFSGKQAQTVYVRAVGENGAFGDIEEIYIPAYGFALSIVYLERVSPDEATLVFSSEAAGKYRTAFQERYVSSTNTSDYTTAMVAGENTVSGLTALMGQSGLVLYLRAYRSAERDFSDIVAIPIPDYDGTALGSIAVTKMPAVYDYLTGDSFDPSGMEVTATYHDGTTKVVNAEVTDGSHLSFGQTSVTLEYVENGIIKKTSCPITVTPRYLPVLTDITAERYSESMAGVSFRSNVSGTYLATFTQSAADNAASASYTIPLTEGVNEVPSALLSSLSGITARTLYIRAMSFDGYPGETVAVRIPSYGFEQTVVYVERTSPSAATVIFHSEAAGKYRVAFQKNNVTSTSPADYNRDMIAGENTVSGLTALTGQTGLVLYLRARKTDTGDYSDILEIPIPDYDEHGLKSIAITKVPDRMDYFEGEPFDPAGMEVTATYNDGTTKTVAADAKDGYSLVGGQTSVTLEYTEKGVIKRAIQTISVTPASDFYNVYVNGIRFNDINAVSGIRCGDGIATLRLVDTEDFFGYVLTLDNAHITRAPCSDSAGFAAGIETAGSVKVELIGDSVIDVVNNEDPSTPACGIFSGSDISFIEGPDGPGSLTINVSGISEEKYGIFSFYTLTVEEGTELYLNVDKANAMVMGISESDGVFSNSGKITVSVGDSGMCVRGIETGSQLVNDGILNVQAGKTDGEAEESCIGIRTRNFTNNGTVNAYAGFGGIESYGIVSEEGFVLSEGSHTAASGLTAATYFCPWDDSMTYSIHPSLTVLGSTDTSASSPVPASFNGNFPMIGDDPATYVAVSDFAPYVEIKDGVCSGFLRGTSAEGALLITVCYDENGKAEDISVTLVDAFGCASAVPETGEETVLVKAMLLDKNLAPLCVSAEAAAF